MQHTCEYECASVSVRVPEGTPATYKNQLGWEIQLHSTFRVHKCGQLQRPLVQLN